MQGCSCSCGNGLLFCGCGQTEVSQGVKPNAVEHIQAYHETEATELKTEIKQVVPISDGAVLVLYNDGTVRTSGNTQYADVVAGWSDVEKLYYYEDEYWETNTLMGVTYDGSVLATDGSLSDWKNVKDLYFYWIAVAAVTHDGAVLAQSEWENVEACLTSQTDVEMLILSNQEERWAFLKKDGSVEFVDMVDLTAPVEDMPRWKGVKEIGEYHSGFYAVMRDGTVHGREYVPDENGVFYMRGYTALPGFADTEKVVDHDIWLFGISSAGRLLTPNGGNIYNDDYFIKVDKPGSELYSGEIDIGQFDQVEDIFAVCRGIILLNEDGMLESINENVDWDFSAWNDIKKIFEYDGEDSCNLYGIRKDGTVAVNRYNWSTGEKTRITHYRGWKLQDIYTGYEGVVGLTTEGKLVGDGSYANVDFSVFER